MHFTAASKPNTAQKQMRHAMKNKEGKSQINVDMCVSGIEFWFSFDIFVIKPKGHRGAAWVSQSRAECNSFRLADLG